MFNCWPSENSQGGCDVNIEYELEHDHLELNDVCIAIPLPVNEDVAMCGEVTDADIVTEVLNNNIQAEDGISVIPTQIILTSCCRVLSIGSSPVVSECDGEYTYEPRKNMLLWTLPIIDASNKSGAMEFSATALPGDFFPVTVNFVCKRSYANLKVALKYLLAG
uniref:Coatomer subunit delta n=1 Tax=Timema bartmani TaxID=61472 RepID=A0A7R9END6_9NEOP|nr:unnamed protein product [Timema bartmani]